MMADIERRRSRKKRDGETRIVAFQKYLSAYALEATMQKMTGGKILPDAMKAVLACTVTFTSTLDAKM